MLIKRLFVVPCAVVAMGALVVLGSCTGNNKGAATPVPVAANGSGLKIAYVNVDSLNEHYELLKTKMADFKKEQERMDNELQASYLQMQQKAEVVQKKVQMQTITESEYKNAEKEMMLMQQSLEGSKQSMTEKLLKKQDDINKEMRGKLDSFIEVYNKDKHYDFILRYSAGAGSQIMYANKQYEITKDVIDGMNASSPKGTDKKK